MAGTLEGKVAVVTGGGGGLGTAICARLSSEGAAVAVIEQEHEKAKQVADSVAAGGGRSIAVEADVSDKSSVDAMAGRVVDELGGLDILINNAAIYPRRAWTEIEEEEWDRVMAVNLKGYFLCARAAFPTDAEKIHPDQEGYNRWVLEQQSVKRRGTPEDIGNLVAFLASDNASFITGQTIGIDCGWMMH